MCCCLFDYTDGFSEDIFGSWKSKAATAATTYWIIFSIFLTPRSWGVCALVLAPSACRSEDLGQGYHPFQCFDIPGDLGFPRGNFDWFFGWQVYGGVGYWCTWFFYISSSSEKLQSLGTDLSVLTEHLSLLLLVDHFPNILSLKSCFCRRKMNYLTIFPRPALCRW